MTSMQKITTDSKDDELAPVVKNKEQLFYRNGAAVYPLKDGQPYWYNETYALYPSVWIDDLDDQAILKRQGLFLTEQACKNADDVDAMHDLLFAKITEINAANNWILNWSNTAQLKYWLVWDHLSSTKMFESSGRFNHGIPVMCMQAREFMLSDQVSNNDFRKFLKIYN